MHFDLVARPPVPRLRPRRASYLKNRARAPDLAPASARVVTPDRAGGNARSFSPRVRERARAGFAAAGDRSVEGAVDPARLGGCSEKASARARARDTPPRAMGGQPAFSGTRRAVQGEHVRRGRARARAGPAPRAGRRGLEEPEVAPPDGAGGGRARGDAGVCQLLRGRGQARVAHERLRGTSPTAPNRGRPANAREREGVRDRAVSRAPDARARAREAPRDRPSSFWAPGARPSFQIFRARPREGRGGALATASATARARAVVPPIDRILGQSRNLRGASVAREAGRPPTLPRSRPRSRRSRRSIHHDPPGSFVPHH